MKYVIAFFLECEGSDMKVYLLGVSSPSVLSKKSGKLKTGYKRDFLNVGCDVDFEGPIIHAAAVVGYEGWLAGYQMAFDTAKSKLTQNNFALGYKAGDFQLHTNV
jgi:hypothetical protein